MVLLYGRAGRVSTKNAGFRPLVPPPVWSTIYLLLQKVTRPRFTILNGFRPGQWPMYDLEWGERVIGYTSTQKSEVPPEAWQGGAKL